MLKNDSDLHKYRRTPHLIRHLIQFSGAYISVLVHFLTRAKTFGAFDTLFCTVPIMARSNDSTKTTRGSIKGYVI